jgi:hypothetical protein
MSSRGNSVIFKSENSQPIEKSTYFFVHEILMVGMGCVLNILWEFFKGEERFLPETAGMTE